TGSCFSWYAVRRVLHSFPTRRSSDLVSTRTLTAFQVRLPWVSKAPLARPVVPDVYMRTNGSSSATGSSIGPPDPSSSESSRRSRSEEHTSELQSRENLVCRLLLEKKK